MIVSPLNSAASTALVLPTASQPVKGNVAKAKPMQHCTLTTSSP